MKLIGKIQVPAALHSGNKSCAFRRGGWLSHAAGPKVGEKIFISIYGDSASSFSVGLQPK